MLGPLTVTSLSCGPHAPHSSTEMTAAGATETPRQRNVSARLGTAWVFAQVRFEVTDKRVHKNWSDHKGKVLQYYPKVMGSNLGHHTVKASTAQCATPKTTAGDDFPLSMFVLAAVTAQEDGRNTAKECNGCIRSPRLKYVSDVPGTGE
ncbi:hypothetical protein EVAR_12077_1 [Eumeta japonica]|uniref:Uncharacterized protein n=1 Tax=Eumeta variegata TaxID=151549 RepID=A0A4C1U6L9_EUMVA|nr:hypothetical protein EVAR_12077_1 [Eumeta japonica]